MNKQIYCTLPFKKFFFLNKLIIKQGFIKLIKSDYKDLFLEHQISILE